MTGQQAFKLAFEKWENIIDRDKGSPFESCGLCYMYGSENSCSIPLGKPAKECPLILYDKEFRCVNNRSPWRVVTEFWGKIDKKEEYISACMAMYLALLMAKDG